MNCPRCQGFTIPAVFSENLEHIHGFQCLMCGYCWERNRQWGVVASGEVGVGAGEVKGSGRYERIGYGKSWTAPNLNDVEA